MRRRPKKRRPRADRPAGQVGKIVTLTTDFGTKDPYCGALKGVLLTQAPGVQVIDLSHEIPPQDILAGAWVLRHAAFEFPPGSVHLAVVDPGVGSQRRALAVRADRLLWVGPDNGLLSFAFDCADVCVHEITRADLSRQPLSATFHGRDLFAPAAAYLANGLPLEQLGPKVCDPVRLVATRPVISAAGVEGGILHVDHYGNLVSCIRAADLGGLGDTSRLHVHTEAGAVHRVVRTYSDIEVGCPAALIGSAGLLELVVRNGSAATHFGLQRGDSLHVRPAR